MGNLIFGIPKKTKKSEEWNFNAEDAVIKIEADRGSRKPKRIFLNKLAYEMLSNENILKQLGVNFDNDNKIVRFANVEGLGVEFSKVTKNAPYKFSDAKIYDYLISLLSLDSTIDNYFKLVLETEHEFPCAKLVSLETVEETNTVEDITGEVVVPTIEEQEVPEQLEGVSASDW